MLAALGVMEIDANVGGPIVKDADAVTDSKLAVMVDAPWATDVARPAMPTPATEVALEDHDISDVTSCTDPLL
jgi:hypothetical protein